MENSCTVAVRSYECDSYGHVNNAVYLNYLELGRHAYLRENGISMEDLRVQGIGLWVARVAIDYRSPASTDDVLTILTRPVRKTRIGGVLSQRIAREGRTVAEAEVTWVCVDQRGRPARLPTAFNGEGFTP